MSGGPHAKFPGTKFVSQAEFVEYCRLAQPTLDRRYLFESALTTRDDDVRREGTCAPCLRRAAFTTDTARWPRTHDGKRLPDWTDALMCDCEDHLSGASRAVLHFALAAAGLGAGTRLLLFGPEAPLHRRLTSLAREATHIARLSRDADGHRLDLPDGACHLAVASDCLHRMPPLRRALAELRRALRVGGSLIATVPFRYRASRTVSRTDIPRQGDLPPAEYREPVHEIGWDILDLMRQAGFRQAALHGYWSNELGYLGSFNMILHAVA